MTQTTHALDTTLFLRACGKCGSTVAQLRTDVDRCESSARCIGAAHLQSIVFQITSETPDTKYQLLDPISKARDATMY